jgi:SAM-dependent methyltransferase
VLHYIDDWESVCREWFRVLKPKGWLVVSTGHPFGDWLYASRFIGEHSYFETRQFDAEWKGFGKPFPIIRSYRRSLQAILNPILRAGFHLEEVLEAQPTSDYAQVDLEGYAKYNIQPSFLCLRARKP